MDNIYFWVIFNVFVLGLLILDLFVLNKKTQTVSVKSALWWSAFWIGLAVAFNIFVYWWKGKNAAFEFLTGYLLEESLSVDNLFVFMLIFNYFRVPAEYQRKVLFWGIIGALVLRAFFIVVGVSLINQFHWMGFILGGFLIFTGAKMALEKDEEINPEKNPIILLVNKFLRVTKNYHGSDFFTRINGQLYATPLFIVVLVVETTDVVFAVDSIPAILAVSKDPFIVYTSNVFALLGLRSLYFALAGIMQLFHYINYGLSLILVFIGIKLVGDSGGWFEIDMKYALMIVAGILTLSILFSIWFPKKEEDHNDEEPKDESVEANENK
ncbi:MAG: TerC family protein [Sporocytophaga sp.]|uniref:TerC family protein n=1 Tax=Sporocytophaga sp. TaxID=2231183 RepID=UPI001B2E3AA2|nr:TerC family protein [Sporocytophaga sp.]MBO9700709.1 TerC family protein [Sporocytophaga sp.]